MRKSDQLGMEIDLATPEDRTFCETALPRVSRTFALSIQALPASLRDAVGVAYLLCRIVDTIEDDAKIRSARTELFDAFDRAMVTDVSSEEGASVASLAAFEKLSDDASLGPTEAERELVQNAGAVFRVYRALPREQRAAIEPHVAEMSRGMREYSTRADQTWAETWAKASNEDRAASATASGLRLTDVADLERYCYFVAGTVGELLTSLFLETAPQSPERVGYLRDRAVSFGLGLQLVNIVKDVSGDFERGDCFIPRALADLHGLPLSKVLDPQHRKSGLAVLRALCERARVHLDRATEYTMGWPAKSGEGSEMHIRLFCSVPLALAYATLREVEDGRDALIAGRAPTVSRALVQAVFGEAVSSARDDIALSALFDKCRFGAIGRCPRPKDPSNASPFARRDGASDISITGHSDTSNSDARRRVSERPSPSAHRMAEKMQHGSDSLQPERHFGGRVFVTGSAGHLGANLLHRLVSEGREVRVLLLPGDNNDAISAVERATGRTVERFMGDLRDLSAMQKALDGCETAFHVAAKVSTVGGSADDLRDLFETNVVGTANLLRAARDNGTKRVVVSGSFSAVGYDVIDTQKPSNEAVPFYPFEEHLPYGRTKMQVEHECLKAVAEGQDVVIATSCAVLGPFDYIPSRMGKTLMDFTHGKLRAYVPGGFEFVAARDIVDGHVRAMSRGRTGQKYIISTEFATVDQLMDIFEEVSGRPRPKLRLPGTVMAGIAEVTSFVLTNFFPKVPQRFTPGAVRILRQQRHADTTKARTELGFEPTSIRSAIHEAYADFARRGLVPASATLDAAGGSASHKAESTRPNAKEKEAAA